MGCSCVYNERGHFLLSSPPPIYFFHPILPPSIHSNFVWLRLTFGKVWNQTGKVCTRQILDVSPFLSGTCHYYSFVFQSCNGGGVHLSWRVNYFWCKNEAKMSAPQSHPSNNWEHQTGKRDVAEYSE